MLLVSRRQELSTVLPLEKNRSIPPLTETSSVASSDVFPLLSLDFYNSRRILSGRRSLLYSCRLSIMSALIQRLSASNRTNTLFLVELSLSLSPRLREFY